LNDVKIKTAALNRGSQDAVCPGFIHLDGHDLQTLSLTSLRGQLGLVQQNVFLKNASVAENIRIGKGEASEEELIKAARSLPD